MLAAASTSSAVGTVGTTTRAATLSASPSPLVSVSAPCGPPNTVASESIEGDAGGVRGASVWPVTTIVATASAKVPTSADLSTGILPGRQSARGVKTPPIALRVLSASSPTGLRVLKPVLLFPHEAGLGHRKRQQGEAAQQRLALPGIDRDEDNGELAADRHGDGVGRWRSLLQRGEKFVAVLRRVPRGDPHALQPFRRAKRIGSRK